jgi:hypothetical protein
MPSEAHCGAIALVMPTKAVLLIEYGAISFRIKTEYKKL